MFKDKLISNMSSGRNRPFFSQIKDTIIRNSHLIDFNSTKQKKSYVLRNHPMG